MPKKQSVTNKRFQKFLIYVGCSLKRISGDHFVYTRADLTRPIIIPLDNPLPQFIVKNNLDVLGISWAEFFEIIEKIQQLTHKDFFEVPDRCVKVKGKISERNGEKTLIVERVKEL